MDAELNGRLRVPVLFDSGALIAYISLRYKITAEVLYVELR
jgi:hypothetical protein